MSYIIYKTEPLKEDIHVFHSVFFGEWNEIEKSISHKNLCKTYVYAVCHGLSRFYLNEIGTPPNYEWFYQAIIDLYIGDVCGNQYLIEHAHEYLLSLKH